MYLEASIVLILLHKHPLRRVPEDHSGTRLWGLTAHFGDAGAWGAPGTQKQVHFLYGWAVIYPLTQRVIITG